MILCEIKDDKAIGYKLDPIPEKVREFKEEQLNENFKIHTAFASHNTFTIDGFGALDDFSLNIYNPNKGRFHFLSLDPLSHDKYNQVLNLILNGDLDDKSIYTFCKDLQVSPNVKVMECRRLMLMNKYIKYSDSLCREIYKAENVIEINEKLHFLLLLLRKFPNDFANQYRTFNLSEEEMISILDNFIMTWEPVFTSSLDYLQDFRYFPRSKVEDIRDLAYFSDNLLRLVRKK